jgi:PAS domain S-box-containing protein
MNPWRDTVVAFSALPEVGGSLLSGAPAFVWSRDGARVLWANPIGASTLGQGRFERLWERRWPEKHALRRTIASLGRALPERGMLARLRLAENPLSVPMACRCSFVRAGNDERGILIVGLERVGEVPSFAELALYFSGAHGDAALLSAAGEPLVESAQGAAAAITPATRYIDVRDGLRKLRLYLIEHTAEAEQATPELAPPIAGDEPALSITPEGLAELFEEGAPTGARRDSDATSPPVAIDPPAHSSPDPRIASLRSVDRPQPLPQARSVDQPAPLSEEPEPRRAIMAGRVAQELSRKPVRFLWQTDASDRYLFVSPGLPQVVGRNADVVGERWQEVSARLHLDPTGRIGRALKQRDTWSGLSAWWPIEGSNVRVPVELTALPVFGPDQSFQGYRGFGILRPAEALMPNAFESRFGSATAEQLPPYEESASTVSANVVPIRSDLERLPDHALTAQERNAFEEIAAALRERVVAELGDYPPAQDAAAATIGESDETSGSAARAEERSPPEPLTEPDPPADRDPSMAAVSQSSSAARAAGAPREIFIERAAQARPASALGPKLAETQRRLRELTAILDTATDGVVILDAAGVIESVNASAEALFGRDANEIEGRRFDELLTSESRKSALDYFSGLKESGVASLLNEGREVEAIAGAGSIPLFMTMGRISGEEAGRFCAVLRDITHWKRIETELTGAKLAAEQASQQKSEFLARVSHEVRTPLNAIIGFAEVMIEERFGAVGNEKYREYLRDIRTSGEHVVSLVNDLLDISKIEAGKLDLHFTAVKLNEVVRESIALMQPQANRARVVLRTSLSQEVPAIVADERTLRQIVLNLLSNSVKFTGPGGQVIASTSLAETGEAVLRVRDTGEGMSEKDLARALEPFRQLSTATMSDQAGTGLGQPLTKALVEANRATLAIRSAKGEGTVVTITIPATRVLSE